MIKTAATNPLIAARVKVAVDRDVAWYAKKLEASETSRRKPEIASSGVPALPPIGKRKAEEQESEENAPEVPVTFEENMSSTPGSSSQGPSVPKVKSKFDVKKRGEKAVVGGARRPESPGADSRSEPPAMDIGGGQESLHVLPSYGTVRLRPMKREASEEPDTEYPHVYEKYQRIDGEDDAPDMGLMEALEEAEAKTIHLTSLEYCLPLITCEEPVGISYLDSDYARDLSDAISCTREWERYVKPWGGVSMNA